jgi:hypothetical protein
VGGRIRSNVRSFRGFHLLLVALLAASVSLVPVAISSNSAAALDAAVPTPNLQPGLGFLASDLGRSFSPLVLTLSTPPLHRILSDESVRTGGSHAVHRLKLPATPARKAGQVRPDSSYGCVPALAYLRSHAAPGFTFQCPGWADGHQAMTCENIPGLCPGTSLIAIAVPCAAAYMNEASNSWVLTGRSDAPIDPYGYCS